jgi:serine/threonine protein kinase
VSSLVHINPSNILLSMEDNPIITDFNSCTPISHSLNDVGRTYQWCDENVHIASPSNDLDAVALNGMYEETPS